MPVDRPVRRRQGARVIVLSGDLILLQGDTDPGILGSRFWQVPGGGVDDGESTRAAAVRELFEETGLTVAPEELEGPIATRTVTHGYSDRILVQDETFYRLRTVAFEPVDAALTTAERARRVATAWFPLTGLPEPVWPAEVHELASWRGPDAIDLGAVEESTVPTE